MPITLAPVRLASCTAIDPTPPAAPHRDHVPGFERHCAHAGVSRRAGDGQRTGGLPGHVLRLQGQVLRLHDRVFGVARAPVGEADDLVADFNVVAPGPSFVTIPARSLPSPDGKVAGQ